MAEFVCNLSDINLLGKDPQTLFAFLINTNLIKIENYNCVRCSGECEVFIRHNRFNLACKRRKPYRCNFTVSLSKDTWFDRSKLSYVQILSICFCFINSFTVTQTSERLHIGIKALIDWFNFCREVLIISLSENKDGMIGGPNKTVEIDESKFGRRKFNHGRQVEGQWVFGGVERESGKCFFVPVERRDEANLVSIIKANIKPGTTIISDCWKAYANLDCEGFKHLTVNHSITFKDPDTSAHTHGIEGTWWSIKRTLPSSGRTKKHFEGYLATFIWKKAHQTAPFEDFLKEIAKIYKSSIKIEAENVNKELQLVSPVKNEVESVEEPLFVSSIKIEAENVNKELQLVSPVKNEVESVEEPLFVDLFQPLPEESAQEHIHQIPFKESVLQSDQTSLHGSHDLKNDLPIKTTDEMRLVNTDHDTFSSSKKYSSNKCIRPETTFLAKTCNGSTTLGKRRSSKDFNLPMQEIVTRGNSPENSFSCEQCSYSTVHQSDFELHLRIHPHKCSFELGQCLCSVKETPSNTWVQKRTDEKPYKCDQCSYAAKKKSNLAKHLFIHSGKKPFKCDLCSYRANQRSNLLEHQLIHSDERPLKCNKCSYRAKQKSALRGHLLIHSEERPFKCDQCPYSAKQKSVLREHLLNHSGERRFRCDQCSYAANQKVHLENHLQIHSSERPFKCDQCSYAAKQRSALREHALIHSVERPFKCEYCSYTSKRKKTLLGHLKIHS